MTAALAEMAARPDGLAIARKLLAEGPNAAIGETLRFNLVEVDAGRAVFEGIPGPHAYNPMGFVHGGYAATLLDSACGIATLTRLPAGHSFTTLELKVAYHRQMSEATGSVRAEAVVTSFGRRVAFTEGRITDEDGRLLASATSTLLVIAS
jgi:uncharacterized protein (TIGR00369 family)